MPSLPTPRNSSSQTCTSSTPTLAASAFPNPSFEGTPSSCKKRANLSPRAPANRVAPPALARLAISPRAQKKPPSLSSTGCVPRCLPRQINSRVLPPLGPRGQSPHAQPLFGRPAKKTFSVASSALALLQIISVNTWPFETGSLLPNFPNRPNQHLNYCPIPATNRSPEKCVPHWKIQKNGFSSTPKPPASQAAPAPTRSCLVWGGGTQETCKSLTSFCSTFPKNIRQSRHYLTVSPRR